MTKHTATTNNAQQVYDEIDRILGDVEEFQVRKTLAYLQARCISIHYIDGPRAPIDVWTSQKLPLELRRTVRKHREKIAERMHAGDSLCCPTPLHKRYHRHGICQMCRRIEPSLEPVIAGDVVRSS